MISCPEKQKSFLKMCINQEDYYIIILNILVLISVIIGVIVKFIIDYNHRNNLSIEITQGFFLLGEGPLNYFYSIFSTQPKVVNSKKKLQNKIGNDKTDKSVISNCELRCNQCNRTLELSYHNTISKLVTNTSQPSST